MLLLDDANDELAINVSRCLQLAGGYDVHCLSGASDCVLRWSKHARVRHVRWDTPSGMLAAVAAYVDRWPVDVIVPLQEAMIVMAGEVAEQLGRLAPLAPVPAPDLLHRVDDKWSFHQLMSDAGVPVPRTVLAKGDPSSSVREPGRWGSPLLLKPRIGSGGVGIRQFERADDLFEALEGGAPGTPEDLIVQEFIPGVNVSCNLLSVDGEIIAQTVSRTVLSWAHPFKSAGLGIEFIRDEAVSTVARSFSESSRWTGVVNLNLRIDSRTGQPLLIEANPRYWQTVLGSLAMGTNFPDIHCRLALGLPPEDSESRLGFYLDTYPLLMSPRNCVSLLRRDPGFLRYSDRRVLLADPRVDVAIVLHMLKKAAAQTTSRAGQAFWRALGDRGRRA